jgi:hypothetical protein
MDTLSTYIEFAQLYNKASLMDDESLVVDLMYINDVENDSCEKILARYFSGKGISKQDRVDLNIYFALYYVGEENQWNVM